MDTAIVWSESIIGKTLKVAVGFGGSIRFRQKWPLWLCTVRKGNRKDNGGKQRT